MYKFVYVISVRFYDYEVSNYSIDNLLTRFFVFTCKFDTLISIYTEVSNHQLIVIQIDKVKL